jgi:hypothetical protein
MYSAQNTVPLPYDDCFMNLEYTIGKNRELSLVSCFMLMMFVFIIASMYNLYKCRVKKLINLLEKYKIIIEDINDRNKEKLNQNTTSVFSNFANSEDEEDSESAAESRGGDAVEAESENQYNLRSRTRRRLGSELSYDFDRDYNHLMIEKSTHLYNHWGRAPPRANIGIRGKDWQMD